tara:strand:- start:871 stop:1278 length:408 start_codon:yes stop_codon:yes gene_type:complete
MSKYLEKKIFSNIKRMTSYAIPGFERVKCENHFNYTEDQLGERKLALKQMKELYPDVPNLWAEWVYDLCKNTPEDKLKEIMKKVDTEPSRFVAEAGESHTLEIIDAEESFLNNEQNTEKKNIDNIIKDESSEKSV